MIKYIELVNGQVILTEHCYMLKFLKDLIDAYPEHHLKVIAYVFYRTCPNEDTNPFFSVSELDKDEMILQQIEADFSTDDVLIEEALEMSTKFFDTPTARMHMGMKKMIDRLADYMGETEIEHGRDGNINSLVAAASKYDAIRNSFKGVARDLKDEQKSHRGGTDLAYDQKS